MPQARPSASSSRASEVVGRGATLGQSRRPGGRTRRPPARMAGPAPATFAPTPAEPAHREPRETGPELAGFGEAGLPTRTSASGGARTMTGQEVPRDGLPAPQVARPASLGTAEVLSSRWVSTIAPAGAGSQSAHRGSAGRPRPWASGRGHPQAGQGQLGEASTQEPEATKHSSAKSPDNFAPNVLFGKYQTAQKNWKVQ